MFTQKGLFRTNCMDCLDRTNVIQSLIAWENLIQGPYIRHDVISSWDSETR